MAESNIELDSEYRSTEEQETKWYSGFRVQFEQYHHLLTEEEKKMWFALTKSFKSKASGARSYVGMQLLRVALPSGLASRLPKSCLVTRGRRHHSNRLRDQYLYANLERDWPNVEFLTGVKTLAPPQKLEVPTTENLAESTGGHSASSLQLDLVGITSQLRALKAENEALKERVEVWRSRRISTR